MNAYYPGSLVKLQATFQSSGVGTDPTSLRLLYKEPNGTVAVKTTTECSTGTSDGIYYYNLAVTSTQVGMWYYGYESTGAVVATYWDAFEVLSPLVST